MGRTKTAVRWFHEIGRGDYTGRRMKRPWDNMIREAGGKGANLAEMTKAGFSVPPGYVVLSTCYFDFIKKAGLAPFIKTTLQSLDVANSEALKVASKRIKDAILEADMPPYISEQIQASYEKMGGGYVAVRSSATAEDLPDASFAGQQSTFLNVHGKEHVVEAVKECWASLFEARAIFYREENTFDHMAVGIAVPVQRMVNSEVSGVMFTVEPVHNDHSKIFIEAIYGLGEGIVSGQISPDTYIVSKLMMTLDEAHVAEQTWQLVRDHNGIG